MPKVPISIELINYCEDFFAFLLKCREMPLFLIFLANDFQGEVECPYPKFGKFYNMYNYRTANIWPVL